MTASREGHTEKSKKKRRHKLLIGDVLSRELTTKVNILEGGKRKRITYSEMILTRLAFLAANGNDKATKLLFTFRKKRMTEKPEIKVVALSYQGDGIRDEDAAAEIERLNPFRND